MRQTPNEIIEAEVIYKDQFSEKTEFDQTIQYCDDKLPDMYGHNLTYIKQNVSKEDAISIIKSEIINQLENKKSFLQIEYEGIIKPFPSMKYKPNKSVLDYYYFDVLDSLSFGYNEDTIIKEASTPSILKDGITIDILTNQDDMGEVFATKRIKRKTEVYQALESKITFYVIYYNNEVIGNVEYMKHKDIVKIEDFDIYEPYQRKGHGSSVLHYLIKKAKKDGAKGVYLITYNDDTSKHMYEKCGFQCVGKKMEIFFDLPKKK